MMSNEKADLVNTQATLEDYDALSSSNSAINSSHSGVVHTSNRHVNELFTIGGCVLATLIIGYNFGFTSSSIADLENEKRLTKIESNWFASLLYFGAIVGSLAVFLCLENFGRKPILNFISPVSAIGWWLIVADFHVSLLFIGRTLCGISFGALAAVLVTYLTETVNENWRGIVLPGFGVVVSVGQLLCFVLRLFISWQWLVVTALFIVFFSAIAATQLPESPRWLMKHGRQDEARENLKWLRMGDKEKVEAEMSAMEQSSSFNVKDSANFRDIIREQQYRKPALLSIVLALGLAFSCHAAVSSFVWQILKDNGIFNESMATFGLGLLQVVAGVIITLIANMAERRTYLTTGGIAVSVSLLLLSLCNLLQNVISSVHFISRLSVVALVVYYVAYVIGWNAFAIPVASEILPTSIRGKCVSLACSINLICNFVISLTFQPLESLIQPWGTFLLYGTINLIWTIIVAVYLPVDIKTKTLEEIELKFQ